MIQTNLEGAQLYGSDLSGSDLREANLHNAILVAKNDDSGWYPEEELENAALLTDHVLASVSMLRGATMPNGDRYNGRFNLSGDIEEAKDDDIDLNNPEAMADWYGVSLIEYQQGQSGTCKDLPELPNEDEEPTSDGLIEAFLSMKQFASENIARLRREAGLAPDTGLPVEPTNGVEPQPADAPAPPAPRRNGHKASMVTHRVWR